MRLGRKPERVSAGTREATVFSLSFVILCDRCARLSLTSLERAHTKGTKVHDGFFVRRFPEPVDPRRLRKSVFICVICGLFAPCIFALRYLPHTKGTKDHDGDLSADFRDP